MSDSVLGLVESAIAQHAHQLNNLDPIKRAEINSKEAETADRKSDTELKRFYAQWFMWILIGQLVVMSLVFIAVGWGCLTYNDENALRLYMGGTLTEVFGVVLVITRYLFSRR